MTKNFDLGQHLTRSAVNVRDYGAKGDGVTDNTVRFAAVMAAGAGGDIYIPRGTYLVDSVTIPPDTLVYGDGYASIIRGRS